MGDFYTFNATPFFPPQSYRPSLKCSRCGGSRAKFSFLKSRQYFELSDFRYKTLVEPKPISIPHIPPNGNHAAIGWHIKQKPRLSIPLLFPHPPHMIRYILKESGQLFDLKGGQSHCPSFEIFKCLLFR